MGRLWAWILVVLAAMWVVVGWVGPAEGLGGARLWSASPYRHLGGTVSALLIAVALVVVLVPWWRGRAGRSRDTGAGTKPAATNDHNTRVGANPAATGVQSPRIVSPVVETSSRFRSALPVALLVAGGLFGLLQSRYAFLGDNWLRVQQAIQGTSSAHDGGMLQLYHASVVAMSRFGWEAGTTFRAISIVSGLIATAIWVRILHDRAFAPERASDRHSPDISVGQVFLGTALFLLAGWTEIFCGYLEVYPPLLAGLLLWVWLSIRAVHGERLLPAVILFLWIGLAFLHRATWIWSPALALALWASLRGRRSFPARKFLLVTGLLCAAGTVAAYFLSKQSSLLLRWFPTEERPYAFISFAHQIDVVQALWLGTATGVLLFFIGIGRCVRAQEISSVDAFLLWASLLPIVALSLFNPVLGAVDWDIWMLPLPFLLLFGLRQVRIPRVTRGPILALQLLVVGPWLLLHANPSSIAWIRETVHADRADYYQTHPSELHLAFLFAANGLEAERRTELKAGLVAHPNDPRFPLNLAITSRADGDLIAAEELAFEAYRRRRGYLPALIQLYEVYTEQQRKEDRAEIARTLLGAEKADPEATYRYVSRAQLRMIEQALAGR